MVWSSLRTVGRRLQVVLAIVVCTVATLAALPVGPAHAMSVARYDGGLLATTNMARGSRHIHQLRTSQRLTAIAHRWAKHLARTGSLYHNPNLESQVQAGCPRWTAVAENIAAEANGHPRRLFRAYMRDPAHRENMLGGYTQVGIATVTAKRHGHRMHYNVIDFATHCPS